MTNGLRVLGVLLLVAFAAGCASNDTHLTDVWSDPNFHGPIHFNKVLVCAITSKDSLRRQVEGHVSVLMTRANGVPSYMAIPDSAIGDVAKVKAILKENNFDGVITLRLKGTSVETNWIPAYYPSFYGYYGWAYPMTMAPGYLDVETKVKLETKIYALNPESLVWAGLSNTFNPTSSEQVITDLAERVVADLQKRGLVEK